MPSTQHPGGRPRRFVKILIVFVLLAAAGLIIADRSSQAPGGVSGGANPPANRPATAGEAVFKAGCDGSMHMATAGHLKDRDFSEVSGITASRLADDTYWVHNDSGDSARVFAVSASGKRLGTFNLTGVTATDWEDIASGPGPVSGTPYLYVADTGDNTLTRGIVQIYRFPEPQPDIGGTSQDISGADTLSFSYPDHLAHNTEAVFVDPGSGKIYFIDKNDLVPSQVFEAPAGLQDGSQTTLTRVGQLGYRLKDGKYEKVTAADISPSGGTIAVRTYEHLYLYDREPGRSVAQALSGASCVLPTFTEDHGEAVGFMRGGNGLVTTSEGRNEPIHSFTPK